MEAASCTAHPDVYVTLMDSDCCSPFEAGLTVFCQAGPIQKWGLLHMLTTSRMMNPVYQPQISCVSSRKVCHTNKDPFKSGQNKLPPEMTMNGPMELAILHHMCSCFCRHLWTFEMTTAWHNPPNKPGDCFGV